ncbi:Kinase, STE STE20 [Giardia muris]|uniref:non-specific serine/threonine protein kinase n=1 Tax=Giardia muris TaxID=5742 RepID=A0A4Z1SU90_GIAMU|nr:Kinase, STE STE20 [Giardia muris]|eukprot:TNJ28535.1 Kinase, STE STE20 [Giardia muris]
MAILADLVDEKNPRECFELLSVIGTGSYGTVWQAFSVLTNEIVAIKRLQLEGDATDLAREIRLLRKFASKYIVGYIGSFVDKTEGELWVVLEYCSGGSLSDLMRSCSRILTEEECAYAVACALLGLKALHEQKIVHRDIKANNLLVTEDAVVKLADFGVSAEMANTFSQRFTMIGTPYWLSPQQVRGTGYSFKADIWALGITAIELTEGKPPLADMTSMRAVVMISKREPMRLRGRVNPATGLTHSDVFADFVDHCLQMEEEERWTPEQLLEHPFITTHCTIEGDTITSPSKMVDILAEKYKCSLADIVVSNGSGKQAHEPNYNFGQLIFEDGTIIINGEVVREGENDTPALVESGHEHEGAGTISVEVGQDVMAEECVGSLTSSEDDKSRTSKKKPKTRKIRGGSGSTLDGNSIRLTKSQRLQASEQELDQAMELARTHTHQELQVMKAEEKSSAQLKILRKAIMIQKVRGKEPN